MYGFSTGFIEESGGLMAKQDTSYINWYNSQNYDRLTIVVPKGTKDNIKAEAGLNGQSVNEYLLSLIPERLISERKRVGKKERWNEK